MAAQLDLIRVFQLLNESFQARTLDARIIGQKKTYFIQEFGINLGYRFQWYIYGPYCFSLGSRAFEIASLYQDLDLSRMPQDFAVNETTLNNLRQFFEDARRLPPKVNVEKTERFWLELASSIHFLIHKAIPRAANMQEVNDTIRTEKPIYNSNDVRVSTEFLKRHGLVSNDFV